jgi:TonB family protein
VDVAEVQPELIGGLEALAAGVVYPELARRAGIEGQVVVQFIVDETGGVTEPVVLRSPSPLLSEAALHAVGGVRFTPGAQDGRPVKVRFAVPIAFRLTDSEPEPEPEIYEVVETPPQLIGGIAGLASRVRYPEDARRADIEGVVLVQFIVDREGRVEAPFIFRSDHPALNEAALAAVRSSRFTPGMQKGETVRVRFTVPIAFRLR